MGTLSSGSPNARRRSVGCLFFSNTKLSYTYGLNGQAKTEASIEFFGLWFDVSDDFSFDG